MTPPQTSGTIQYSPVHITAEPDAQLSERSMASRSDCATCKVPMSNRRGMEESCPNTRWEEGPGVEAAQ